MYWGTVWGTVLQIALGSEIPPEHLTVVLKKDIFLQVLTTPYFKTFSLSTVRIEVKF